MCVCLTNNHFLVSSKANCLPKRAITPNTFFNFSLQPISPDELALDRSRRLGKGIESEIVEWKEAWHRHLTTVTLSPCGCHCLCSPFKASGHHGGRSMSFVWFVLFRLGSFQAHRSHWEARASATTAAGPPQVLVTNANAVCRLRHTQQQQQQQQLRATTAAQASLADDSRAKQMRMGHRFVPAQL